jgi:hypothetical protein
MAEAGPTVFQVAQLQHWVVYGCERCMDEAARDAAAATKKGQRSYVKLDEDALGMLMRPTPEKPYMNGQVRLFRNTGSIVAQTDIYCIAHIPSGMTYEKRRSVILGHTDQAGSWVPAVPNFMGILPNGLRIWSGDGFIGYHSVPDAEVAWWKNLPLVPAHMTAWMCAEQALGRAPTDEEVRRVERDGVGFAVGPGIGSGAVAQ